MVGTLLIVFMGERFNPRVPFALIAVVAAIIVTHFGNFAAHGVATLGKVAIVGPHWRLSGFSWSDAGVVATTAATVALVVISQSAATSRSVADEMNVEVNINQDFIALGLANLLSGVAGTIPVNASPARTGVVRVAGGKTSLVSLIAGLGALLVIFIAPALRDMPLAALAGVLFYVAGRLMKVKMLRQIAKVDRYEFALAIITAVAVILIGVQEGLAVAVGLAILDQLRRSARPRTAVLGRRPDSTSWEPLDRDGATLVDAVTVLLFTAPLYFINAQIFRTEVHSATRNYPNATHFVVDAAAITDVDFTGLSALAAVIADLKRDHVEVVFARASDSVVRSLKNAPSKDLNTVRFFGTVEEAVLAKRA
jgi:SulP family sulfate permease